MELQMILCNRVYDSGRGRNDGGRSGNHQKKKKKGNEEDKALKVPSVCEEEKIFEEDGCHFLGAIFGSHFWERQAREGELLIDFLVCPFFFFLSFCLLLSSCLYFLHFSSSLTPSHSPFPHLPTSHGARSSWSPSQCLLPLLSFSHLTTRSDVLFFLPSSEINLLS